MCDYHSISVNRRGTIAHVYWNSHTDAVYQKKWKENIVGRTYHWDFEYNPLYGPYPGALDRCTTRGIYTQEPTKRVLDAADEHYRRLEALHNGDYSMLDYFSGVKYSDVRKKVAQQKNIPVEILIRLVNDPDQWISYHALTSPHMPEKILREFAKNGKLRMQQGVARNPNTPPDVLAKLSRSNSNAIRHAIAANNNTPVHVLPRMAQDQDKAIRYAVACNHNAPLEALAQLAEDKNANIRHQVAHNPSTPAQVLTQLAQDKKHFVRRAITFNPNVTAEALAKLAQYKSKKIRLRVARHQNTPIETLEMLLNDPYPNVQNAAKSNLNTQK